MTTGLFTEEKHSFRFPTFESLIKLVLAKDDPQVMQSTGVKLHPENHVPTRAAKALVVALELQKQGGKQRRRGEIEQQRNIHPFNVVPRRSEEPSGFSWFVNHTDRSECGLFRHILVKEKHIISKYVLTSYAFEAWVSNVYR